MVPEDDQAMVLPWASVIVIIVLLKEALTCATPEVMFLRSRRRGLARPAAGCCSLAIQFALLDGFVGDAGAPRGGACRGWVQAVAFFLPAIGLALPLRVRALVCVR